MFKKQQTIEQRQKQVISRIKNINSNLRKDNEELRKEIKEIKEENRNLKIQIEELRKMVFGERRDKKDKDRFNYPDNKRNPSEKKSRNKESYQREIPIKITETKEHHIDSCPDCKTELKRKKIVTFFEEDIVLPNKDNQLKEVIEHKVEKGYCNKCKKWFSSEPIPPKKVIIGRRVRFYICYLNILLRLSYSQIQRFLKDTYQFDISHGEIENILEGAGVKLKKEFEKIKKEIIEGNGVHMDETSWGDLYLWVMASINNEDTIYHIGNRGNGNIDNLIENDFKGVRINDGYSAYKNKSGIPQQCWAHPHRKLRDLAYSSALDDKLRIHCEKSYRKFSSIYSELRKYISEPFIASKRKEQKEKLLSEIRKWRKLSSLDPQKLKNIKKQFLNEDIWFNCLNYENIPCDNNKAERKLRHFVIKRKISFGTKTKRTSDAFSILASVFMTYWGRYRDNFFEKMMVLY